MRIDDLSCVRTGARSLARDHSTNEEWATILEHDVIFGDGWDRDPHDVPVHVQTPPQVLAEYRRFAYPSAPTVSARFACIASNADHTPSFPCHCPSVAALEYSVLRASKKLACSTPESIDCSQGSGFSFTP
jgi:hypothetical protein